MSVHDGHRARKKALFREQGLDAFSEHEALELLLYYALPQGNVNPLAHELIREFGSLEGVLTAPAEELLRIKGVREHTATLLSLVVPLVRAAQTVYTREPRIISGTEDAGSFFLDRFHGEHGELLYEACLDAKGKLLRCVAAGTGADAVSLNLRRIVEIAFQCNASVVLLAHNHPSGVAVPSADDCQSTRLAWDALRRVGIRLADHIIVAENDFVSLREDGLLPKD